MKVQMGYLAIASLVWAFSFGLIGRYLGGLDSSVVAFVRLLISLAVFAPFLRLQGLAPRHVVRLMAIGAVQYGVMYAAYIQAFRSLAGHEVALFTIMTPLFVTLLDAWRRGRFQRVYFFAAVLAVAGGAVLTGSRWPGGGLLTGILLIQVSNLCFAAGQVEYKLFSEQVLKDQKAGEWRHFGFLYLGAVLAAGLFAAGGGGLLSFRPTLVQGWVLLYLGIVPSALGFFLWNAGARRVNAGALAVFNNAKIPLAVAVSLLLFHEKTDLLRLAGSAAAIVAALALASRYRPRGRT